MPVPDDIVSEIYEHSNDPRFSARPVYIDRAETEATR